MRRMGDPLYLSLWLKNFSTLALPLYMKKAMSVLPVSRLEPGGLFRVCALSFREPPVWEEVLEVDVDPQDLATRAQDFLHDDCALQFETRWDLYQWDGDWELKPSPLTLEIYGPEFDSGRGEHVRVDFGAEALFLPQPQSDNLRPVQSNIRSLLHLAQDVENELIIDRRILWSEEEENFVDKLMLMLD